jgi:hypothetical protein
MNLQDDVPAIDFQPLWRLIGVTKSFVIGVCITEHLCHNKFTASETAMAQRSSKWRYRRGGSGEAQDDL